MNFRIVIQYALNANEKGTYTVEGWDLLRRQIESLEAQGKKWIVVKA